MFFHRKKKSVEKTVAFRKQVDVLNYVPRDYTVSRRWALFSDPARFTYVYGRKLQKLNNVDELNGNLFDAYIDSEGDLIKTWGDEQHTHHRKLIVHNAGILRGNQTMLISLIELLKEDLAEVDKKTAELEAIRKGENNE